jgi:tetratricopeptide (TPR) repeat protein
MGTASRPKIAVSGPGTRIAGTAREIGVTCWARRNVARRCGRHLVAALSVLLTLFRAAIAEPAPDPWETYIDAAVASVIADDFPGAEALLLAALGVVQQSDIHDPRPTLSRLLLLYVYSTQGKLDPAKNVARMGVITSVDQLDEKLLPFAQTLERLANNVDSRWKNNKNVSADDAEKQLSFAAEFFNVETTIYNHAQPTGSADGAQALALYGLILFHQEKYDDAKKQWESALAIWDKLELQNEQLSKGSQRVTLVPESVSSLINSNDLPLYARIMLGRLYRWDAETNINNALTDKANSDSQRAISLHTEAIKRLEPHWHDNELLGWLYVDLGEDYRVVKRLSDAERAYSRSLTLFIAAHGEKSDDAKNAAHSLATVLRDEGYPKAAEDLEVKYGFKLK